MKIKNVLDECFQDYEKTSMLISMAGCDWKCCNEAGIPISICQNSELAKQKDIEISTNELIERYLKNPISKAIIFAGLEPMLQFDEITAFVNALRYKYNCDDDVVIYTGYYPEEKDLEVKYLSTFKNIIIKFGRYMPDRPSRHDDVLGIDLISDNQYAVKIS